jgi:hypothetical protein
MALYTADQELYSYNKVEARKKIHSIDYLPLWEINSGA